MKRVVKTANHKGIRSPHGLNSGVKPTASEIQTRPEVGTESHLAIARSPRQLHGACLGIHRRSNFNRTELLPFTVTSPPRRNFRIQFCCIALHTHDTEHQFRLFQYQLCTDHPADRATTLFPGTSASCNQNDTPIFLCTYLAVSGIVTNELFSACLAMSRSTST